MICHCMYETKPTVLTQFKKMNAKLFLTRVVGIMLSN